MQFCYELVFSPTSMPILMRLILIMFLYMFLTLCLNICYLMFSVFSFYDLSCFVISLMRVCILFLLNSLFLFVFVSLSHLSCFLCVFFAIFLVINLFYPSVCLRYRQILDIDVMFVCPSVRLSLLCSLNVYVLFTVFVLCFFVIFSFIFLLLKCFCVLFTVLVVFPFSLRIC